MNLANGWHTLASGRRVYFEDGRIARPEQQSFPDAPTHDPDEEPELSDQQIVIQSHLIHPFWSAVEIAEYMTNDELRPVTPDQVVDWLLQWGGSL